MFGYIVDNWGGPRRANWIGCCCVGLGLLALSQSDSKALDLYPSAFVLLALGGPGVHISLFHLAMLFPPACKNTVQSVLVGAFIFSGIAFPVERWLFSLGFARANVLGAHGILLLCQTSVALTLWPPAKFSSGDAVRFRRNSFLSYIVIRKEAEVCRMSPRQHDAEPSPQVALLVQKYLLARTKVQRLRQLWSRRLQIMTPNRCSSLLKMRCRHRAMTLSCMLLHQQHLSKLGLLELHLRKLPLRLSRWTRWIWRGTL